MMLLAIPQYEAPYVNENGDIIIRPEEPLQKANRFNRRRARKRKRSDAKRTYSAAAGTALIPTHAPK